MREDGSPDCSGQKMNGAKGMSEMLHALKRNLPKYPSQTHHYQKYGCKKKKKDRQQ